MNIADIITPDRVRLASELQSRKRALEQLAELLARAACPSAADILNGLLGREKLGSTGVGDGVAIPHTRLRGVDECIGAFMRLPQGVDFEATDEQPVDLIFGLLVPEEATEAHLKLLRQLAEILSEPEARSALRTAGDDQGLYRSLLGHDTITS